MITVITPTYGIYPSPIQFAWEETSATSYEVTLIRPEDQIAYKSSWITDTTWTFDIPGEQYGNWEWYVTSSDGEVSNRTAFVFDPVGPVRPRIRIAGDVNGDCIVNEADYNAVLSAFGSVPGDSNWNPDADLDGNGIVNIFDYNAVIQNFGRTCPP